MITDGYQPKSILTYPLHLSGKSSQFCEYLQKYRLKNGQLQITITIVLITFQFSGDEALSPFNPFN